jgi:uncharacterized BrkB/YihY/UPF0761 family membrane protein
MDPINSSFNLATFILVGFAVLVVFSMISLFVFWFVVPSPLERNVYGRIEAAQKPEDVLKAQRSYAGWRFLVGAAFLIGGLGWLYIAAPDQTRTAAASFGEAVVIAGGDLIDATRSLLQELGIGNECECADPSRISGNGP